MFNACAPITLSIQIAKFRQYRTRAISLNLLLANIIHCIALTSMQPYTSRTDNYFTYTTCMNFVAIVYGSSVDLEILML